MYRDRKYYNLISPQSVYAPPRWLYRGHNYLRQWPSSKYCTAEPLVPLLLPQLHPTAPAWTEKLLCRGTWSPPSPPNDSKRCLDTVRLRRHRSECTPVRPRDAEPDRAGEKVAHLRQRSTQRLTAIGQVRRTYPYRCLNLLGPAESQCAYHSIKHQQAYRWC